MNASTLTVRETIESHLDDLCPVSDALIDEAIDLIGDDISASTVEEAFEEAMGEAPDWDARLYEDIASALLEDCAGTPL